MQRETAFSKPHYFNTCSLSAKLLCALIFVYCAAFCVSCGKDSSERVLTVENQPEISASAININTASEEELEKLPLIGKEYARRIVEHREKYGAFRRPADLILVRGMTDKKFREIRSLIKVE